MRLIRVFPRRIKATTPTDELAFVGDPPFYAEADAVHISVTWTWDLPEAERLERQWRHVAPVTIGGPATGMRGEAFTPGLYIKPGYTITSRGCPNHCWFCSVPKREGPLREYPIQDGWNVLDDNILACSETHIRAVFAMLARQKEKPTFSGGLEAAKLKPWIAQGLRLLRPEQLFFAYDTPDDYDPLVEAGKLLIAVGFDRHQMRAYVLCGWKADTMEKAKARMIQTIEAGFFPMAMAMGDEKTGAVSREWATFAREWIRPAIIAANTSESNWPHKAVELELAL